MAPPEKKVDPLLEALKNRMSKNWEEHEDDAGRKYYHNTHVSHL